jgi:hypothetical protein
MNNPIKTLTDRQHWSSLGAIFKSSVGRTALLTLVTTGLMLTATRPAHAALCSEVCTGALAGGLSLCDDILYYCEESSDTSCANVYSSCITACDGDTGCENTCVTNDNACVANCQGSHDSCYTAAFESYDGCEANCALQMGPFCC